MAEPYWRAFLSDAVVGAVIGGVRETIDYGKFDIGDLSNHVLGSVFIFGFAFMAAAALVNWRKRNPHMNSVSKPLTPSAVAQVALERQGGGDCV